MKTEYMLVFNDPHCGSKIGLLNPATRWGDAGPSQRVEEYRPFFSAWQRYLWEEVLVKGLQHFYSQIGDDPVTLACNGDAVQGDKFLQAVATAQMVYQRQIAVEVFQYIYTQLNVVRTLITYGTEVHTGEGGDEEIAIASDLAKDGREVCAMPMGLATINDAEFSIAHHGPNVGEANLRGNAAIMHLRRRMYEEITILQRQPPKCYLYGHVHRYAHVWHAEPVKGKDYTSHLIVCPALCASNGYARQKSNSSPILYTGMILIRIDDGEITDVNRDYVMEVDLRTVYSDTRPVQDGGTVIHHYAGTPRPGNGKRKE